MMISLDSNKSFQDNYKILIGAVLPRPIAVVSTLNLDGSNNLAPFSFFTAVSAMPMILAFCPLIRTSTNSKKDTVINIEREKEFVINIGSFEHAALINACSEELPYGTDEFKHSGLTALDSDIIKSKRVKEFKIHFECKLRDILSYGETIGSGRLITGEVVKVHISEDIYEKGKINTQKLAAIGRGAGNDWFKTSEIFELERKMKAQIQK